MFDECMSIHTIHPDEALHLRHSRAWAWVVLLAMAVHTYFKWKWGTLPELLWGCNVASFVIILGLWLRNAHLVGSAFLWHLCVGEPGYVFGVLQTGHTHWISIVVHSLPTLAAFFYLRKTGLPRTSPFLAFLMFVALVPISHYLTPPNLNINMAHQRLWILQKHFSGNWDYRFVFSGIMLGLLMLGDLLMALLLKRPGRVKAAG
jgi:hypothetical protein